MDSRLLNYYERELRYIREAGAEFADQYPKIAGRLGIEKLECADPYVERLLEGFAFLAARIQLKMDSEMPRFTQHLLELVYPHYLCQAPSAVIARFDPDLTEGRLSEGHRVGRGTSLRTVAAAEEKSQCQYTTTQDVDLWPLEVVDCSYFSREVTSLPLPECVRDEAAAGLRIRLRSTAGLCFSDLQLDQLPFYLDGPDEVPVRIYEQLHASTLAVIIQPAEEKPSWQTLLDSSSVQPVGFDNDEALVAYGPQSFQGYRLLREYFSFPNKFLFTRFTQLISSVKKCRTDELDLIVVFDRCDPVLERSVKKSCFHLHCTPAINLFSMRADSIHLSDAHFEHHVVPDRARPLDFEVFDVTSVIGRGAESDGDQTFEPFYSMSDVAGDEAMAYYTLYRMPRVGSTRDRRDAGRSGYTGSEVYLTLVDGKSAPYRHNLQLLTLDVRCTNRHLPLLLPMGTSSSDFTIDTGAPVDRIRCIAGPTAPQSSLAGASGDLLWRLVNHLSLNYLSLVDNDSQRGAAAIRELLSLYSPSEDSTIQKQINGIRSVHSSGITRALPAAGPIAFGRGVEVILELDESAFTGFGGYLLAAVMEQFFSKYVSINSFTETVLRTRQRGEVKRWTARTGRRAVL